VSEGDTNLRAGRGQHHRTQASCDRLTENVCAVLFAYSYAVRHTHFHDVTHGTHVFG